MTSPFAKSQVEDLLVQAIAPLSEANAAWYAGSKATLTEDKFSDTDLVVISETPEVIFTNLEKALASKYEILRTWTVEESIWKSFSQKFYVLNQGPEYYYLDIGVFNSLDPKTYEEFFNVQRHGNPQIIFDKTGVLAQAAKSSKQETPKIFNEENQKARFEIMYRTFLKESLREKYIDTFIFYQRLVTIYVQHVRAKLTPQRHDFGFRYLYQDLPLEESAWIEKLLKANEIPQMQKNALEIRAKILY